MDKYSEIRVPIANNNVSIKRDESKCVLCGKCKDVCKKNIGVAGYWAYDSEDIVCINCGQCAIACPVQSITEIDDGEKFKSIIDDKSKTVVFIVSPAVRVSIGETAGLKQGEYQPKKMVGALKKLGAKYVFDVTFGADLTIMEEASELINRIKNGGTLPMFTSCCPAWVKFVETFYPQYITNLSSCKSPISMQSSLLKNFYATKMGINPQDLVVCAITPCLAKKFEAGRKELSGEYGQDTDLVLSVREIAKLFDEQNIDIKTCDETEFDSMLPTGTGAGIIFGSSGGVMEAAVRTAYYMSTGLMPPDNLLKFEAIRGYRNIKTATVNLLGKDLTLCVASGTLNARKILDNIATEKFDFLEIMACPNGCVGGGGQPIHYDYDEAVIKRGDSLYQADEQMKKRCSFENEQVKQLYKEFLGNPLSEKSEKLLHTHYNAR